MEKQALIDAERWQTLRGHNKGVTHVVDCLGTAVVAVVAAGFAWQIRKEKDKLLYFVMGIGVGRAVVALITP